MKTLLLEDELMLQNSIKEYLEDLGHQVESFSSGDAAKNSLLKHSYDILILDINVPKLNGFELLETIKDEGITTPVIFISALIDIEDITKAFTLGAADYLKKPFHLKELELRLNSVVTTIQNEKRIHLLLSKNYSFNIKQKDLYYKGEIQKLTKKQIQIMELLTTNVNQTVNFDKFRSFVWNDEPIDNPSIRAEISRLRKSLKEDFIDNLKGIGYRVNRYSTV